MKGVICYYSGSGNTRLAVHYLAEKIKMDFQLTDIIRDDIPNLNDFDVIGFATFTDFWGVPQLFHNFMETLDVQTGKPAFLLNTFGLMSGGTLKDFKRLAEGNGFSILAGYSLHTPESYPPMRQRGKDFDDAPNPKELKAFDAFITGLDDQLQQLNPDNPIMPKFKLGFGDRISPIFARTRAKKDFGEQHADHDLCTQCGTCEKGCPYKAVHLEPYPVFNHQACLGCWACYNHCPAQAIHTPKFTGKFQYPKPSQDLKEKLG